MINQTKKEGVRSSPRVTLTTAVVPRDGPELCGPSLAADLSLATPIGGGAPIDFVSILVARLARWLDPAWQGSATNSRQSTRLALQSRCCAVAWRMKRWRGSSARTTAAGSGARRRSTTLS
ncbi:hypothetical protein M6B38_323145 [Iris pallida]|uniref:Uncharacterized protein n=1 Tax=Iris pallida TaxID=29817 RepID=A0AAX6HB88_IRIPA|nr:hypothetical protein M6B38_323145 [Iris pallida]